VCVACFARGCLVAQKLANNYSIETARYSRDSQLAPLAITFATENLHLCRRERRHQLLLLHHLLAVQVQRVCRQILQQPGPRLLEVGKVGQSWQEESLLGRCCAGAFSSGWLSLEGAGPTPFPDHPPNHPLGATVHHTLTVQPVRCQEQSSPNFRNKTRSGVMHETQLHETQIGSLHIRGRCKRMWLAAV